MHFSYTQADPIELQTSVQAMSQLGKKVWIISECGDVTVVDVKSHSIELQDNKPELSGKKLVGMIAVDDQAGALALVYSEESIFFISACPCYDIDSQIIKTSKISIPISQLHSMETCRSNNSSEVWCGCNMNTIRILMAPTNLSQPRLKTTLDINAQHRHLGIPQDSSIVQLKATWHSLSGITHMHALHSCGGFISCWSTGDHPSLSTVIKLTQLGSPGMYVSEMH